MIRKVIQSSNLCLRFYAADGWTKEELDALCVIGEVYCAHPDDDHPYFTLDHRKGSMFDVDKLMESMSELVRAFDDYPNQSDRQFIEYHNS